MFRSRKSFYLTAFSVLALGIQVAAVLVFSEKYQFDFRAYYFAPTLLDIGQDPYSPETAFQMSKDYGLEPAALPFLYAPISIFLFKPISLLEFKIAYVIWLGLQVCAISGTILILVRQFKLPLEIVIPIIVFGLNGTIAAALRHGQLTIIILFLLLAALALSRRNPILAGALVVLASVPKIWVTPLSVFLAVPPTLSRVSIFLGVVGTTIACILSALFWAPELFTSFREGNGNLVLNLEPRGPFRGSFVNFIATVEALTPLPFESRNWIYGFWIFSISTFSFLSVSRLSKTNDLRPETVIHLYSILALGLCIVSPRMLVYQWGIALPGVICALALIQMPVKQYIFGFLTILPTIYISQYAFDINVGDPLSSPIFIPWGFSNIIISVIAWFICVRAALRP